MESRVEEYLSEIRKLSGLQNAILRGITLSKRDKTAEFFLITDKTYSMREETQVKTISDKYLPEGFSAKIKLVKRVPDKEIIKSKIYEYIKNAFPAAAAFMDEKSVHVEMLSSGANFYVDVASGEQNLFKAGNILDATSQHLSEFFCGTFYGNVRIVEKKVDTSLLDELPEEQEETLTEEIRRFRIENYEKIDGMDEYITSAVYMADCLKEEGTYAVCGKITYIEEIKYVKHNEQTNEDVEKTRFSIALSDDTLTMRTTYFPKKATLEKVRNLKIGDWIMIIGTNEEYRGSLSFKASKINYATPPKGFVPEARKGKPVPKFYHTIFPEKYVDFSQAGLFDSLEKPADLKNNVFVVFDLETTGLNNNPAMGRMDKIIEIGAVKLENGEISEKFSSFIACSEKLSAEIVELTGIHDADLIGAPEVDKVLADFFKFADGAYLVGHNVTFDYRFVQYYGEQNGYMFQQKTYDTMTLSQELLRGEVNNFKLNSIADYYGFTFNHHRAFDDACVTAKVFIELMKKRKQLP